MRLVIPRYEHCLRYIGYTATFHGVTDTIVKQESMHVVARVGAIATFRWARAGAVALVIPEATHWLH